MEEPKITWPTVWLRAGRVNIKKVSSREMEATHRAIEREQGARGEEYCHCVICQAAHGTI